MKENSLLKQILKAKTNDKKNLNELIDEFIQTQTNYAKEHLEEFLSSLFVYVNKNFDKFDMDDLLQIVNSKLTDLNVSFDTKDIDSIYASIASATSVGTTKIVFNKTDIKAIETIRESFYWVGTEYNQKTQEKLKNVIESAYKGEVSRADLSAKLKEEFEGIIKADELYFQGVADHIISQSQNISRVNQALKYDVKYFKVRARIDGKTSDICRSMHNKIISAKHLSNQVDNILGAKNIGEKKAAAQWSSKPIYGKLPSNFGLPPYHFRCRTGVEPVWIKEDTVDGKKVRYTSKKKDDILTHIDKTAIQRRVNTRTFNHSSSSRKRDIPLKDVISAFNSISDIAPHRYEPNRTIAKSANGYFMVFDADYLYTIFKEPRKNYFKDNANLDKKEVIKWKNTQSTYQMDGLSKQERIKKMMPFFLKKMIRF